MPARLASHVKITFFGQDGVWTEAGCTQCTALIARGLVQVEETASGSAPVVVVPRMTGLEVVRTSAATQHEIDLQVLLRASHHSLRAFCVQIARLCAGANLPFSLVENVQFRRLVDLLRPGRQIAVYLCYCFSFFFLGCTVPDRHSVGQELLEEVYAAITVGPTNYLFATIDTTGFCNCFF